MNRREFCEFLAAVAGAGYFLRAGGFPLDSKASWPADANYSNNRAPLQQSRFVKLPLGAGRPSGWLLDQLTVQANGLTSHLDEVWSIVDESAWKGDEGENVLPECCTARFVPRWLEGLTVLSGMLHDDKLSAIGKPYMEYALSVKDLATVTPSVTAWCHFGRFMPGVLRAHRRPARPSCCSRHSRLCRSPCSTPKTEQCSTQNGWACC